MNEIPPLRRRIQVKPNQQLQSDPVWHSLWCYFTPLYFSLAHLSALLSCQSRLCSWLFGQIQKVPVFVWQCDRFRQGEPEMSKCHTFFSVHFFVSSGRDRTRRVDAPHPADRTAFHCSIQKANVPELCSANALNQECFMLRCKSVYFQDNRLL